MCRYVVINFVRCSTYLPFVSVKSFCSADLYRLCKLRLFGKEYHIKIFSLDTTEPRKLRLN